MRSSVDIYYITPNSIIFVLYNCFNKKKSICYSDLLTYKSKLFIHNNITSLDHHKVPQSNPRKIISTTHPTKAQLRKNKFS